MISARPPDSRSSVAKSWNTRTGSSELSTRDGAREADLLGAGRARGQRDGRGRDREVGPVVLADAEHVEADLVGQLGLLQEVAHPLLAGSTPVAVAQLRERVHADLHHACRVRIRGLGRGAQAVGLRSGERRTRRRGRGGRARRARRQHRGNGGAGVGQNGLSSPGKRALRSVSEGKAGACGRRAACAGRLPRAARGSDGRAWPWRDRARICRRTTRIRPRAGARSRAGRGRSGRGESRATRAPREVGDEALSWEEATVRAQL